MLVNARHDFYLDHIKDDPVRPHIPASFRISSDNQVWVLEDDFKGDILAMICVAYCNAVPTNEAELHEFSVKGGHIAVFYTVWSYARGAGRDLVFAVAKEIKLTKRVKRFVTLSPKTEMARKFHLANGAVVLQENPESVNYEYLGV